MKKERIQLIFLIVLLVGGLSYSYISFLLLPQLGIIENKDNEVKLKETEYVELMTYSANPTILDEQIETKDKELTTVSDIIPSSLDRALITYNTYATLKRNNLIGENIVFDPPEDKGTYETMSISLTVSGTPSDVLRSINELQNSSDALAFRSANFTAEEDVLRAEVKLQAFALRGNKKRTDDLPFMNVPIGIDHLNKLFPRNNTPLE